MKAKKFDADGVAGRVFLIEFRQLQLALATTRKDPKTSVFGADLGPIRNFLSDHGVLKDPENRWVTTLSYSQN
jgi:hypothetical protein